MPDTQAKRRLRWPAFLAACALAAGAHAEGPESPGVIATEFLFTEPPAPSCHASTIAETRDGLVAAWFGGTAEKNPDVGIWVARSESRGWSRPVEVADGKQADGKRYPCWNPVLFQPESGPLLLFFKVGPSPREWWGMRMTSDDAGRTWSKPGRLPDGILGPIKNKPVQLAGGPLLCPSSTEDHGWRVHFEKTADLGKTWTKTEPLGDGKAVAIIQPTILTHPGGRLQFLCRSEQGRIFEAWSQDGGSSWSAPTPTVLPNPDSGIDAVTLKDGRALLIYNHTRRGRSPINVGVSEDGKVWKAGPVLETEPGEYSYPAVIQASDGRVHVTYTWKRRLVKYVVLDPAKLVLRPLTEEARKPGGS